MVGDRNEKGSFLSGPSLFLGLLALVKNTLKPHNKSMKTSHISLAIVLCMGYSTLWAQAEKTITVIPKATTAAPKVVAVERQAARQIFNGYGALVRPPYVSSPIPSSVLQSLPNVKASTVPLPQTSKASIPKVADIAPKTERYVSPFRDFLRDEKDEWEMPEFKERSCEIFGGSSSCVEDVSAARTARDAPGDFLGRSAKECLFSRGAGPNN